MASVMDTLIPHSVRSFHPKEPQVIEFGTPLTLIVGHNGSGKTTIIECLKYATTGEFPPNSKGGAFIHDPTMVGEKEVLAKVMLQFRAQSQAKMVVTRNLLLTVKKTTRSMKTLECNLVTKANQERQSLSSRAAQLDQMIPYYMGVSRAVLDNVIFCHQDESLWPMCEPAPLKKKFDEIFEALKYTKALDNIKDIRKNRNKELSHLKEKEQWTKINKDKGDKAEKDSRDLDAELKMLRTEIAELHAKAKEAEEKWQETSKQAANFEHVVKTLGLKREKQEWLQANVKNLSQGLKERNESDEWLQSELDQFEERVEVHKQQKKQQAKQFEDLRQSIEEAQKKLRALHAEAGKHEWEKANHEEQIEKRKAMIRDSSRRHKIRGFENNINELQIEEFLERIKKLSKDQNAAVEKARLETEKEMQKAQETLSRLGEHRSALNEGKNSSKQQILSNDGKMSTFQRDANKIDVDEGSKAALEADIEDLESRLEKAKHEFFVSLWDTKIQEANSQMSSHDEETRRLNGELVQCTKQAGDLARLGDLKKEVENRRRALEKTKAINDERLRALVDAAWHPSTIEAAFQKKMERKTQELSSVERDRDHATRELEQVDYNIKKLTTELEKSQQSANQSARRVQKELGCEAEGYLAALAETQEDRDVAKADVNIYETQRQYFQHAVKVAQDQKKCKLCTRDFRGSQEVKDFVANMERKATREAVAESKKTLDDLDDFLKKAKEVRPSYETWARTTTVDIPRLENELSELKSRRIQALEKTEQADAKVDGHKEAKNDLEFLRKPVENIGKYHSEIASLSQQMEELSAKQKDAGLTRTLDEIEQELEVVSGHIRSAKSNLAKLTADKERARILISSLELDLSKAKNALSLASHQLEKKIDIAKQLGELRENSQKHRETVQRLDEQLRALAPKVSEEEARRDDIKQRGLTKENQLQQEASTLSDSVKRLEDLQQSIQQYIEEDGPGKLAKSHQDIEISQQAVKRIEEEQKQIIVSINKLTEELRNHETTKRDIEDNLKYRLSLKELEILRDEISQLNAQNAEADQAHWTKHAHRWQAKFNELSTEKTSKLGTARAKDDLLAKLIADWETDYKGAAEEYKKAHIEFETTKAAVEDLGRYGGALDKAIMKYHSLKMEEINRIVDELWKKTYQGSDVDTILIRSDNETAKGNRSYNYRVCMVKQDAEMDMRGRCSAGQKVLASIIIRLALAECFGINCGMIALDEPTTNLDRDNIQSLARSLHDIIKARQHQANFQLIVITHDEEFLRFMKCPEFCDNYWLVSRTKEGWSDIRKQSIHEVM